MNQKEALKQHLAKLADLLVEHNLVEAAAVDDPEGYDHGGTEFRILSLANAIYDLQRKGRESC